MHAVQTMDETRSCDCEFCGAHSGSHIRRPAERHLERNVSWPQNHEPMNFFEFEFEVVRGRVSDPNRSQLAGMV